MSGSAVLDMTRNLVVGIVSETWFPDLSTKDRDTAWAVDGRVLSLEPLELLLQDISLPSNPRLSQKQMNKRSNKSFKLPKLLWNDALLKKNIPGIMLQSF